MPEFVHKPVMLAEVLAALGPKPGGRYADGTIGGGGHAVAILDASSPTGWLYGCDRDGAAVEAALRCLAPYAGRFELQRGNYADLGEWVPAAECDGVLLDLGVSSPQLDDPRRGFSFQHDGPLDMRMDDRQRRNAAELVNMATVEELARIFWEFGGERESRRFARAIAFERESRPFTSTGQLAGLIERLSPRRGRKTHPATKVFQALRIEVNDEIGQLRRGLEGAVKILRSGGRLAVITFHSLEDRIAKEFSRIHSRGYTYPGPVDIPELRQPCPALLRLVSRKPVLPSNAELADNPRSRSAQLRIMERI